MQEGEVSGRKYYTSTHKDKDGKVRKEYHGESLFEAKQAENKKFNWKPFVLLGFILLAFVAFFAGPGNLVGYFFMEEGNSANFLIQDDWDLDNGFIRISQGDLSYSVYDLNSLVVGDDIFVDLNAYELVEEDFVYVDLIINDVLVDSVYIFFTNGIFEVEEVIVESEEEIVESEEEIVESVVIEEEEEIIAGVESLPDGWYTSNGSQNYQIDYVYVSPREIYKNSEISCMNGSLNGNITSLSYLWYVNGSRVDIVGNIQKNVTSLAAYSIGDTIECGILPKRSNDLFGYWGLDEGKGTTTNETVSFRYANISSASWVQGRNFQALNMSVGNISIDDNVGINLSYNFTYEFWLKRTSGQGGMIYALHNDTSNCFSIGVINFNDHVIINGSNSGSYSNILESSSVVPNNRWTHLAVSYNNSNIKVYIDGVEDNSATLNGPAAACVGDIILGIDPISESFNFNGTIDEFAIYNASLSQAEIQSHYSEGIVKLSRMHNIQIDATQSDFQSGSLSSVNATEESGNLTLSGGTGAYSSSGTFTSQVFTFNDNISRASIIWNNLTEDNTSLYLKVRTGVLGETGNGTILWSDYSGPDLCHTTDDNLFFALDFSEIYGNKTYDVIGHAEVDMNEGTFYAQGKHGTGLYFAGSQDMGVVEESTTALELTQDNWTISIWVNPEEIGGKAIITKTKYDLYLGSSGQVVFAGAYGATTLTVESTSNVEIGNWSHIAVAKYDNGTLVMYLNGVAENSMNSTIPLNGGSNIFQIGTILGDNSYSGLLDSLAFFNRTLSPAEISYQANDRFTKSSESENIGRINKYVQYKAFFNSSNSANTPHLEDVSLRMINYTNTILNREPGNSTIQGPTNASIQSSIFQANWSTAIDNDSNSIFYEFIMSNQSNFSLPTISKLAINNFSEFDTEEGEYVLLASHLDEIQSLLVQEASGNYYDWQNDGKWGNGMIFTSSDTSLKIPGSVFNTDEGSIEFWFNPIWSSTGTNFFMNSPGDDIYFNRTDSLISLQMGDTSVESLTYNITNWSTNTWYHLAITWKEGSNLSLYINGVIANKTEAPIINSIGGYVFFGTDSSTSNRLAGTIDELRISSVERVPITNLTTTNFTINPSAYKDDTYYWKVRSTQYANSSLENGSLYSNWVNSAFVLDTIQPNVDLHSSYNSVLDAYTNITLGLVTSEDANCSFRNSTTENFREMNVTGEMSHTQTVNITDYGNHTYFFNCSDIAGKVTNTTRSVYIFNSIAGLLDSNKSSYNFTAETITAFNLSGIYGTMASIKLSTDNDISGKFNFILNSRTSSPEISTNGLEDQVSKFHTYLVDSHLVNNMTGNATIGVYWYTNDIKHMIYSTIDLYYFNHSNDTWVEFPHDNFFDVNQGSLLFNTTVFGTFVLSGEARASASDTTTSSSSEGSADDEEEDEEIEIEEEFCDLEFHFLELLAGESNTISVYDDVSGVVDLLLTTNKNLENVIFTVSCGSEGSSGVYKTFSLSGVNIDNEDISSLSLAYAVEKDWIDAWDSASFAIIDENGLEYEAIYFDEDSDYYYYESYLESLGLMSFEAVTGIFVEEEVASGEEEEEEGTLVQLTAIFEGGEQTIAGVLVLVSIFGVGIIIYYLLMFGLSFILTGNKEYQILENKEDNQLESYILNQMEKGVEDSELVDRLIKVGWEENNIKEIIKKFK
jgi:hypothetical protein